MMEVDVLLSYGSSDGSRRLHLPVSSGAGCVEEIVSQGSWTDVSQIGA